VARAKRVVTTKVLEVVIEAQVKAVVVESILAGSYADVVRYRGRIGNDLFVRRIPKVDSILGTRLDHDCDVCLALGSGRAGFGSLAVGVGQQAASSGLSQGMFCCRFLSAAIRSPIRNSLNQQNLSDKSNKLGIQIPLLGIPIEPIPYSVGTPERGLPLGDRYVVFS